MDGYAIFVCPLCDSTGQAWIEDVSRHGPPVCCGPLGGLGGAHKETRMVDVKPCTEPGCEYGHD